MGSGNGGTTFGQSGQSPSAPYAPPLGAETAAQARAQGGLFSNPNLKGFAGRGAAGSGGNPLTNAINGITQQVGDDISQNPIGGNIAKQLNTLQQQTNPLATLLNNGNIFQGVSGKDPFGTQSQLAKNTGHGDPGVVTSTGADPTSGQPRIIPNSGQPVDKNGDPSQNPQFGGFPVSTPPPAGSQSAPPDTYAPPMALTGQSGARDTGGEDALRASYMEALKPNYGFTFQGQNNPSNSFNAVPGAKGK